MTQVEQQLVEALRLIVAFDPNKHAVGISRNGGPMVPAWRDIAITALAEYDARAHSPASPSPVGEGQPQPFAFYDKNENRFWEAAENCRDFLSANPEVIELYTREQMDAAQAPKPASAGGVPNEEAKTIAYNAAWRAMIDAGAHVSDARKAAENAAACISDPTAIAAEADTAREPTAAESLVATLAHKNWDDPPAAEADTVKESLTVEAEAGCTCRRCVEERAMRALERNPPAADRLAQTVTDAMVDAACETMDKLALRAGAYGTEDMRQTIEAALRARESAPAQEGLGFHCKQCGCVFVGRDLCNECYAAAPRAG